MDQLLLQTKLYIPNIPRGIVDRVVLYDKMDLVNARKLCLISTPAGYGKTSLIVSWAKQRGLPLAWVSLDEGDNNFSRFFAYFIAAVQVQVKDFGQSLLERLTFPQGMPHELLITMLVNALDRIDENCIIVLDDYHVIHDAEIHESVQYLLDNLPPKIHLVISTREEPPFSIANLRAKTQLVEIRYSELRFSEGDASEYLNQNIGLDLNENEIRTLVEYTEGWIVGLRLAALSLSDTNEKDLFISQLGSANRYIAGYLFDEVLQRQPKEIRSFLLQSSVLDRFTASLCDAALNIESSRSLIAEIERSNLFIIPLDNQHEWYRYHHKFSELLSDRLKRVDPTQINKIYRRASSWYEKERLLESAIDYAIRAQDFLPAAQLIGQIGKSLFWAGDPQQILNWLEALPDVIYYEHPPLWIMHLWAHMTLAQFSIVADDLASTRQETILSRISDHAVKKNFESSLAVIRALIAINLKYDIAEGIQYAKLGMENVDSNNVSGVMAPEVYGKACMLNGDLELAKSIFDRFSLEGERTKSPFLRMIIAHHCSELAFFQGDLGKTERLLQEAYKIGIEQHLDDVSAFFRVCIDIGRLNYEKGNLVSARQFLNAGVRGGERSLIAYDLIDGYCATFDLAHLDRDFDKAEQIISSTEFLGKNSGFAPAILERAEAMKARLSIYKGDTHSVRLWLDKLGQDTSFLFHQNYMARTAILALVMLKDFNRAEAQLHSLLSSAEGNQCLRDIVYFRTWLARILYQQGNLPAALRVLQKAVHISADHNFVRSILDVGYPVIDLLKILRREVPHAWTSSSVPEYLSVLINARSSSLESASSGRVAALDSVSEPLTDREMEVLKLLAKGCSNLEMAEAMVVSESTVKFHLRNIYLKLGVHTRTQATFQANQLRLT